MTMEWNAISARTRPTCPHVPAAPSRENAETLESPLILEPRRLGRSLNLLVSRITHTHTGTTSTNKTTVHERQHKKRNSEQGPPARECQSQAGRRHYSTVLRIYCTRTARSSAIQLNSIKSYLTSAAQRTSQNATQREAQAHCVRKRVQCIRVRRVVVQTACRLRLS